MFEFVIGMIVATLFNAGVTFVWFLPMLDKENKEKVGRAITYGIKSLYKQGLLTEEGNEAIAIDIKNGITHWEKP